MWCNSNWFTWKNSRPHTCTLTLLHWGLCKMSEFFQSIFFLSSLSSMKKFAFWYVEWWPFCFIIDTLRPKTKICHFPDNIFKHIFLNENVKISIKISLKLVPKGPINNIPALVHIMAWCHPSAKPLSKPMTDSLLMHICVSRPQWVNSLAMMYAEGIVIWVTVTNTSIIRWAWPVCVLNCYNHLISAIICFDMCLFEKN